MTDNTPDPQPMTAAEFARLTDDIRSGLVRYANSQLSPQLGVRVEGSDIVQSAYASLWNKVSTGDRVLEDWGDLCNYLTRRVRTRILRAVERHSKTEKRTVRREVAGEEAERAVQTRADTHLVDPAVQAAINEVMERIAENTCPHSTRVIELFHSGMPVDEISRALQVPASSVRKLLILLMRIDSGLSSQQIAQLLTWSESSIEDDGKELEQSIKQFLAKQ